MNELELRLLPPPSHDDNDAAEAVVYAGDLYTLLYETGFVDLRDAAEVCFHLPAIDTE